MSKSKDANGMYFALQKFKVNFMIKSRLGLLLKQHSAISGQFRLSVFWPSAIAAHSVHGKF